MDLASRLFSPYDLNPGGSNPLRGDLAESIDFERLARADPGCSSPPPTCAPVAVASSEPRDHPRRPARLGLPAHPVPGGRDRRRGLLGRRLFGQPDDHASGEECEAKDIILVQISPVERPGTPPHRPRDPQPPQRGSFNSVLLKELRMIGCCGRSPIRPVRARCGRACAPTAWPARRWSSSAIPPS